MSVWTKRRKINTKIDSHITNILHKKEQEIGHITTQNKHSDHASKTIHDDAAEIEYDEVESIATVPVHVHVAQQDHLDNHIISVENHLDSDYTDDNDQCDVGYIDSNDTLSTNYDSSDDHISDTDSFHTDSSLIGNESDSNNPLQEALAEWAIHNKITHSALKELLRVLAPFHPQLPKDPRTLLSTQKVSGIKDISGGQYYHFGLVNEIRKQIDCDRFLRAHSTIQVQLNVDGLPLFKSTNEQFWPILGLLVQATKPEPFTIGLFCGKSKPKDPEEFLHDFVAEMLVLESDGLVHNGHVYQVCIASVICDTPARAYIKRVKSHAGYSGCDKCTQEGVYNKKMTFPLSNAPLRTDASFRLMSDEDHHTGVNPWRLLSLGMVSAFPLDSMHLVYLGITKRILLMLIRGPLNCRLGNRTITSISEHFESIRDCIPKEFARKPRSLKEIDRWKATEFRLFLLYTGPVVMEQHIPPNVWKNILLLSVAIHLLSNDILCKKYADYANSLLILFVQHYSEMYGSEMVTYNVHAVTHLAGDVKVHGSINNISAFIFESYLNRLKRLIRKPNLALQQVIMRLHERDNLTKRLPPNMKAEHLNMVHTSGPIPHVLSYSPCLQYREVRLADYAVKSVSPDNCVKIKSDIGLVQNIIQSESGTYIVFKRFESRAPFFTYPMDSELLDIHKVYRLSEQLYVEEVKGIGGKYVIMPYKHCHVVMPIIHS